jgi:hypothetical protein
MHVTGTRADNLSSINSLMDDSPKEVIMADIPDVFKDYAASLLTSATQQSIAHKKRFNEELAWLKEENQAEMGAHQKAQQKVQE